MRLGFLGIGKEGEKGGVFLLLLLLLFFEKEDGRVERERKYGIWPRLVVWSSYSLMYEKFPNICQYHLFLYLAMSFSSIILSMSSIYL